MPAILIVFLYHITYHSKNNLKCMGIAWKDKQKRWIKLKIRGVIFIKDLRLSIWRVCVICVINLTIKNNLQLGQHTTYTYIACSTLGQKKVLKYACERTHGSNYNHVGERMINQQDNYHHVSIFTCNWLDTLIHGVDKHKILKLKSAVILSLIKPSNMMI